MRAMAHFARTFRRTVFHMPGTSPLFVCQSNDRYVFLDIDQDRYFGLPRDLEAPFARYMAQAPLSDDEHHTLVRLGLSGREIRQSLRAPDLDVRYSLFDLRLPEPKRGDTLSALTQQMVWGFRLRHIGLKAVLTRLSGEKARLGPDPAQSLGRCLALASAARHSERWIASETQCLRRSLALMHLLLRNGLTAELVIGVKTKPFAAHAWVQAEGHVLNDTVDETRRFTPILVV